MTTSIKHGPIVLVTGGAGFIGSHIAVGLAARGWQVEVLDNLSTGSERNVPAGIPIRRLDIRSAVDISDLFRSVRFDAVVHCAAQTSVERSMRDPELDREINVVGTRLLLDAARLGVVSRFIFMSSGGAIYGESQEPARESAPPAPRSYYGLNKYVAEEFVRASDISHAILRPSNVYGARQRTDVEGGVIAIFRERLLKGEPLVVYGDGSQVRDFVHVSDVVAAVIAALTINPCVLWNVASGCGTSVLNLINALTSVLHRSADIVNAPRRPGDIHASRLSPESLLSTGLWGPPLTLEEGLRSMVTALREPPPASSIAGLM